MTGFQRVVVPATRSARIDQKVVRFCFAKKDETLNTALERLARL